MLAQSNLACKNHLPAWRESIARGNKTSITTVPHAWMKPVDIVFVNSSAGALSTAQVLFNLQALLFALLNTKMCYSVIVHSSRYSAANYPIM